MLAAAGVKGYKSDLTLPGKPDFAFSSTRVAVFVDGCFFHGCPQHFRMPETRKKFWAEKIARNAERDREVNLLLIQQGWSVARFWEHDVRKDPRGVVLAILARLGDRRASSPARSAASASPPAS